MLGVARRKTTMKHLPQYDEEQLPLKETRSRLQDGYASDDEEDDEDDMPSTLSENSTALELGNGPYRSPSQSFSSKLNVFLKESLVMPLMMMYFVMLLINTILRDTKDTMLVNSVAGVAAIPILKSWVTIPSSFSFFLFYSRISHSQLSARSQFLILLFSFALFYTAFALFIYPFRRYMSPREWGASVRAAAPQTAWATLASTAEEWTLGLFYVVSELWSSAVCQLLFWQVANDVMTIRAAKELYPVIGAMGNAGLVVAGRFLLMFADRRDVDSARAYLRIIEHHHPKNFSALDSPSNVPAESGDQVEVSFQKMIEGMDPSETGWLGTLFGIAVLVFFGCAFIAFCYDDVYRRLRLYHPSMVQRRAQNPRFNELPVESTEEQMTTWEAVKMLVKSEPLRLVAILVSSYGVSSSLIEVSWKGQVKRAFSQSGEYSRFMGSFWTWTGLSSMAFMVLSSAMLQRLGYRVAVMFTPFVMMCAGGLFFTVAVSVAVSSGVTTTGVNPPLSVAAYAGALAVLVAKSAKYAVFDATKEMVFIPLDKESRNVGKAAIDVVAYRLSKSGGAFALQLVLLVFGTLDDTGLIPIGIIFGLVLFAWIRAAYATGKIVHEAQRNENMAVHGKTEHV